VRIEKQDLLRLDESKLIWFTEATWNCRCTYACWVKEMTFVAYNCKIQFCISILFLKHLESPILLSLDQKNHTTYTIYYTSEIRYNMKGYCSFVLVLYHPSRFFLVTSFFQLLYSYISIVSNQFYHKRIIRVTGLR